MRAPGPTACEAVGGAQSSPPPDPPPDPLEAVRVGNYVAAGLAVTGTPVLEGLTVTLTTAEFEKTAASCKVQTQSLAAAESRQRQAQISVGDSTVRAPFGGTVSERYVNVGEYVRADTRVAQIVQSDPLRIELSAGEAHASAVHEGQTLRFQVKTNPGKTYTGTVKYVAPALRASTRDLVFEAVVPNPDGALKAGMFVTAWLETGTEERVVVPKSALRADGDTLRVAAKAYGGSAKIRPKLSRAVSRYAMASA